MSKESYYFSHDANARNDEKILMLRVEFGWEGYGLYWALVEMMFESSETKLHHNKIKGIAISNNVEITVLQGVINTCINEGLFDSDDVCFWSESLRRRKDKYKELKRKKSEAGKKGMAKRWGSNNTVITEDNNVITNDNTVITKNNKGKERKVNKNKNIYTDEFEFFWSAYPRKLDKKGAYEKFNQAIKRHDTELVIQGAKAYAKECELKGTEKQFIKHPKTFLHNDSFLNNFETMVNIGTHGKRNKLKTNDLFEQMKRWEEEAQNG